MFNTMQYNGTREENYKLLLQQLKGLLHGEEDVIANLSNASSLLNQFLDDVNWVGFYLMKNGELVLGPFQGLPACVRIQVGKGVCGTAVKENETQRVADVEQFPGHIACDAASKSEIVVPIHVNGEVFGVLDIDSPNLNRFDELDQQYLEEFVQVISEHL
ncbi:GAF domain-containing protein [Salirhabdus salicampi]|uniref:GAF domain-containing protein n=1 Tax=Salirhabdus salicampi TaxID=476102 RepID=UPI0020C22417|nr:GAF domain-containing protein [Salirhabdus salicampi]MCP8617133.1 GAF domain-containing protein [Salirhabdus salicampi]